MVHNDLRRQSASERALHFEPPSGHSLLADAGGAQDLERRRRVSRESLCELHPQILISPDKPHVRPDHRIRTRERSTTKCDFLRGAIAVSPVRGAIERSPETTGTQTSRTPSNAAVRARECSSGLTRLSRNVIPAAWRHSVETHSLGYFQSPALGQGDPLPALGGRWDPASDRASSENGKSRNRDQAESHCASPPMADATGSYPA